MASTGRPLSHTCCGARGAPSTVVDSGPPDRMMPFAPNFAISAGSWSHAQISQYTPISRMRRAMSCVYCAPKSRMRILSLCRSVMGAVHGSTGSPRTAACTVAELPFALSLSRGGRRRRSARPVVRRFLGDLHVVHVALARAGSGHLHEGRLLAHLLDVGVTDVAHRRAQAARELVHHATERAAVRHATLDAFGHQLVGVRGVLEVAVLRAF